MRISVILPCYNSGKYLQRVLNALYAQTFTDFEIICVNDGSLDNTLEILKNQEIPYLRVINQHNTGVYVARLNGVKASKAEFLAFCDSDDIPHEDWLEKLYDKAVKSDADVTVCAYRRVDEITGSVLATEMERNSAYNVDEDKSVLLSVNTSLWNKLYKSELLKYAIIPLTPPRIAEDSFLQAALFANTKKVAFLPDILYDYVVRSNSAVTSVEKNDINSTMTSFEMLLKISPKEKTAFIGQMAFVTIAVAMPLLAQDAEINDIYDFLNQNFPKWRKPFKCSIKIKIAHLCYRLHIFWLLMACYRFITKKMKISIKW